MNIKCYPFKFTATLLSQNAWVRVGVKTCNARTSLATREESGATHLERRVHRRVKHIDDEEHHGFERERGQQAMVRTEDTTLVHAAQIAIHENPKQTKRNRLRKENMIEQRVHGTMSRKFICFLLKNEWTPLWMKNSSENRTTRPWRGARIA